MYSENIEAVGDFINSVEPDIVFLQEITKNYHEEHPDTGAYIAEVLGLESYYAYGPMVLPDGNPAEVGMGIFSRLPLLEQQKILLQESVMHEGKIIQDERFFLQASIELDGRRIGLGTTHLPFHPTFQTTPHKQHMIERILKTAEPYDTYIFGADLNATPYSKAAKTLRSSGFKNAGPALSVPSWTTKPFAIGPWRYEALKWRLDYMLTRGGLQCASVQVLHTEYSDHMPLLLEFTFNT